MVDSVHHCHSSKEGIIPVLESAHRLEYAMKIAKDMPENKKLFFNMSGRGDKDPGRNYDIVRIGIKVVIF